MRTRARQAPPANRIPALDGLRATSIILVCISHLVPLATPLGPITRHLGEAGVNVFFVISGYLITALLLKEHKRTGTVSLSSFYLRRILRITPAYVLLLVTVAILSASGVSSVDPNAWPYLLTYSYNLVPGLGIATIGQVWSLCVEEHFYFLWPPMLRLVGRGRAPLILCGAVVLAIPLRFLLRQRIDIDTFTRRVSTPLP